MTIQLKGRDPVQEKGYWSAIYAREGDAWKARMLTSNITPAPAAPAQTNAEKRYAVDFASSRSIVGKLVRQYAIGYDICAITEYSVGVWRGYKAIIYVRDADTWKIRMAYSN